MYLLDDRQHPWLRIVVTVCSNAQVNFLWIRVSAISGHQSEERVFWCLRAHIVGEGGGGGAVAYGTHLAGELLQSFFGSRVVGVGGHVRESSGESGVGGGDWRGGRAATATRRSGTGTAGVTCHDRNTGTRNPTTTLQLQELRWERTREYIAPAFYRHVIHDLTSLGSRQAHESNRGI